MKLRMVKIQTMAMQTRPAGIGSCRVSNPVGVVVKNARLKAEGGADFAGVGDRTAALRIDGGESGVDVGQRHCADDYDDPADKRDGTDRGEVGWQQGNSLDHVAGNNADADDKPKFVFFAFMAGRLHDEHLCCWSPNRRSAEGCGGRGTRKNPLVIKSFNLGLKQSPHECIINCFSGQRFFPGNSLNIYQ